MARAIDNSELIDAVRRLATQYSEDAKPYEMPVQKRCFKCWTLQRVFVAPDDVCAMCWLISNQNAIDFLLEGWRD